MLIIEDDVMYINRGDDAVFNVIIKDDKGQNYEMVAGETLTMTVRELPTEDSEILMQIVSESNAFKIKHVDTCNIPIGKYSFDVQLNDRYGDIHTVFPILNSHGKIKNWKNFIVDPEVTIP